jgi:energy-coupling factor transport system ATP-binding protein
MLVTEPRLLILDEPTAGQDRRNTLALVELLDAMRARSGLAVLVITHDMTLVARWCTRAVVLAHGRSVFDGPVPELFASVETGRLDAAVRVPEQWTIAQRLWPTLGERVPLLAPVALAELVEGVG